MKHFIAGVIAGIIIGMLCSCNEAPDVKSNSGRDFSIIEVDSCEYLLGHAPYEGYFAHKGNCKYCEQRRRKNP